MKCMHLHPLPLPSEFRWQTLPCSWSIDGEAALTGGGSGYAVPVESQTQWNTVAGDHTRNGSAHTGQPSNNGLNHVGTSTQLIMSSGCKQCL